MLPLRYHADEFIHLCNEDGIQRFDAFKNSIGFSQQSVKKYWTDIEKILDFIKEMDRMCHKYDNYLASRTTFFGEIFHEYIYNDLRALVILYLSQQKYQLNIVLRHFIEIFIYSLWADLISNFRGTLDYYLFSDEWKAHRSDHKMSWKIDRNFPNRSIRERLERIRLVNLSNLNFKRFSKHYFLKSTYYDIDLLFSLSICKMCLDKRDDVVFTRYHSDRILRKKGKEDTRAHFKTDFGYICSFCNKQNLTTGYTRGILEMDDMLDMLANVVDKKYVDYIWALKNIYRYLNKQFVHFSTRVRPTGRPEEFNSGKGKFRIWGLSGVISCLKLVMPLMEYYYNRLRLRYKRKKGKYHNY
jgi:hypothetical protein